MKWYLLHDAIALIGDPKRPAAACQIEKVVFAQHGFDDAPARV
jgi:hypothetical protein